MVAFEDDERMAFLQQAVDAVKNIMRWDGDFILLNCLGLLVDVRWLLGWGSGVLAVEKPLIEAFCFMLV